MPVPITEFPPRETLSDVLNGYIELLQSQCQISYPSGRLRSSAELNRDPTLLTIVKIILKYIEKYTDLGRNDILLLKLWLGVMGNFEIDSFDLPTVMNDESIVEKLFKKGVTDFWPPRISLQQYYKKIIEFTSTERVIDVDIPGEQRTGFIITTPPALTVTLYTVYNVDLNDHSTRHNLKIIIPPNHGQQTTQDMQPIKILTLNAGGIRNPDFANAFLQLCQQHNPEIALVTETRVEGIEDHSHRISMTFPHSAFLQPTGFFGGQWLLWKSNRLTCQLIHRLDRSLFMEATINNQ